MLEALVPAQLADDAIELVLLDDLALLSPLAEDHHGAALGVDEADQTPAECVATATSAGRRRR